MNFRHLLTVVAIPLLVAMTGCAADPEPVVWLLDNRQTIGGHAAELLGSPRVVQTQVGQAIRFNGESDGFLLNVNPLKGLSKFTVEVLFKPEADGPPEQRFLHIQDESGNRALLETRLFGRAWALDAFVLSGQNQLALYDRNKVHPVDGWTWVAMIYADGKLTSYVNGVRELQGSVAFPAMGEGKTSVGVRQNRVYWFKGAIREVRIHPGVVSPAHLQRPPEFEI
jgi:hypothetical protein